MTAKGNVKKKKLSKAAEEVPQADEDDDLDLSHLQKPIETSIRGLREAASLLQTATAEVNHDCKKNLKIMVLPVLGKTLPYIWMWSYVWMSCLSNDISEYCKLYFSQKAVL